MARGKKPSVGRREFLKGVAVGAGALAAVDTPGGKGGGTGARIPAPGRGGRSAADNRRGAYRRPHRLRFHGGRFQIAQPRVRVRGGRFEFPRAARIGGQLSRQQESRVHFVNMLSGQRPGARLFESSFHQMDKKCVNANQPDARSGVSRYSGSSGFRKARMRSRQSALHCPGLFRI